LPSGSSAAARATVLCIIKADRNAPFDTIMQLMNRALVQGFSVVLATTRSSHDAGTPGAAGEAAFRS
jgi:biopolymer transport protein ExbD